MLVTPPTLAVIIVAWNVRELLRRCLQAVEHSLAGSGITTTIIVVDNAGSDATPAMLHAEFPHVQVIIAPSNRGFGAGNNLALQLVLHDPALDFILLLNPDTEPQGAALPRLVHALAARSDLAVVGPQLHYTDGALQPSCRRWPTRMTLFWESTLLDRRWPDNPWARRYRCADLPTDRAQVVDWLVGAALLVRAEAVRRAGLFDERFFLYSEELEWQARLQAAWGGQAICYLPEASVIHHEGRSSAQVPARQQVSFNRSRLLLARMRYGWGTARLLRWFLRSSFSYMILLEGLKLLLGHRPTLRRERLAVYRRVLREL